MDILLIIVVIVVAIIIFGISFYLFAIYCHPQQKQVGNSLFSKIIVVLGMALSWGQILLIPLDVSNTISNGGINMALLYQIIYIIIFGYVTLVSPFTMFFYESDDEDSMGSRIAWSTIFTGITSGCVFMLVFISEIWLGQYNFISNEVQVQGQLPVPIYIMICMCLAGWVLLAIFGGVGLFALPADLIGSFVNRPKILKPEQAKQKKTKIEQKSTKLIEMGESLKQEQQTLNKTQGWWAKRKQDAKVNKSFQNFKRQVIELQEEYEKFEMELKIQSQNPVVFYLELVLGIFCLILTLVWLLQLLFDVILRPDQKPVWVFLNTFFQDMVSSQLNFLATGFFSIITIYLLWCAQKGNLSFGLRIPCVTTFHPMKKNETYLNSFLFNINLMLLVSVSITQLSIFAFPSYTTGCYLWQQFEYVYQLKLFGYVFQKRIFPIIMFLIFLVFALYRLIVNLIGKKKKQG